MSSKMREEVRSSNNYVCMYDENKNRIVSVPRTDHPFRHMFLTILYILAIFILASVARNGAIYLLKMSLAEGNYPWWAQALDGSASALVILVGMIIIAPRFGFFPGVHGGRLALTESETDKKLAKLIKNHPRRLNVDWFRDWAEASVKEREALYTEMRHALENSKKL